VLIIWLGGALERSRIRRNIPKYTNLDILQSVQVQELKALGLINENENVQIIPNTSPLLLFFIIPFQWLSGLIHERGIGYGQ